MINFLCIITYFNLKVNQNKTRLKSGKSIITYFNLKVNQNKEL